MSFSQIPTSVSIISSGLKGYLAVSLTNWTTSALSAIASGSAVEIGNAFFLAGTDITINATSWTNITTASTAYLELTPAGSVGSQTVTAAWNVLSPTWSESKQGWYHSSSSIIRTIGSAYKNSATKQFTKTLYTKGRDRIFIIDSEIGDWNMQSVGSVMISFYKEITKPYGVVYSTIRKDVGAPGSPLSYPIDYGDSGTWYINSLGLHLIRFDAGTFTDAAYNATGYNRGWVGIAYEG
jgi:hypothetical protein